MCIQVFRRKFILKDFVDEVTDVCCKGMWKDTDCSFKGIWSTSFSIAKGLFNTKGVIRNRGSYKQDHTEAQT